MNFWRCILLLSFTASLALGQTTPQSKPSSLPDRPEALVRSLYTQVIARHPRDIPGGEDWKIFSPYFSKALLHRIDLAKACSADWDRSNPDAYLKAGMASAYEIFSGEEGTEPQHFQIQKAQAEQDGSSWVYVRLTDNRKPPERPYTWRIAAAVVPENGRFVIDDVIYINDSDYQGTGETKPPNRRLSGYLSAGCDGPHWIGYSLPNEPMAFARGLYEQVVAHKPLNVPYGEDWKIFSPYFSKALQHKMDVYRDCMADWHRQNQDSPYILKPPGLIENGIFSGGNEEADPTSFQVERAEAEKDGSLRVYVGLRWEEPGDVLTWRVADALIRDNGRLVVDDVIFLKDVKNEGPQSIDVPLSKLLADGCDGPHWVGYRDH